MGVLYNSRIVTDSLVLCLDAGDKMSYPGAGTTWTDLTKNNHNGTLVNNASFNSDNGGGIVLDGTNDYVEITDFETINSSDSSFSCALKIDDITNDRDIITKGSHAENQPILCWFDKSVGAGQQAGNTNTISCLVAVVGTQLWISAPSNSVSADEIFTLDITIDASIGKISMYMNGEFLVSYTNSNYNGLKNTSDNFRLGADINANLDLPGKFYFFRIYNKCLSASEVQQNYNATKARFGL